MILPSHVLFPVYQGDTKLILKYRGKYPGCSLFGGLCLIGEDEKVIIKFDGSIIGYWDPATDLFTFPPDEPFKYSDAEAKHKIQSVLGRA